MSRHALWIVYLVGCMDAASSAPSVENGPRYVADMPPMARTWRPLEHAAPLSPSPGQLMTDGTVIFADSNGNQWWKLTPDEFGGYEHGTWSQIHDSPTDYAPLYFASATLPDGRLIVEGGEYLFGQEAWTTKGAIYDPIADAWKAMAPPAIFNQTIGDASSIVLDDGTFLLTDCCTTKGMALLDPVSLTWTAPVGDGKADIHDEESWAKLWDGRIVTTDANLPNDLTHSEIYDPATKLWTSAGEVPVKLADTTSTGGGSHEVGPEMLRPDGNIVAIGATGHNALFDTATLTWSALPDLPAPPASAGAYDVADGPGATLPNGDMLIAASPGVFNNPTHWYELHDTTFTLLANEPMNAPGNSSYNNFLLVLPTGEILLSDFSNRIELYTPAPGVPANAIPEILDAPTLIGTTPEPSTAPMLTLYRGRSYTVPVHRMNGITQGAYYGDDAQSSTNFPIIKVTNTTTLHAKYCRTYAHSDRSISPDEVGTTTLDIPAGLEPGLSQLVVIANGISSAPMTVNVK
ncbi:MAG: hypothetical protein ABI467_26555 [Kofleriaceae bacterium]